jgi:hypothetical protein
MPDAGCRMPDAGCLGADAWARAPAGILFWRIVCWITARTG